MKTKVKNRVKLYLLATLMYPASESFAAIDIIFDVSSATNTPEAAVASAMADFCPRLQELPTPSAETARLAEVCLAVENAPQTETREAYHDLSARSATSILSLMTHGPLSQPVKVIGKRLAALRRASADSTNAKLDSQSDHDLSPGGQEILSFGDVNGGSAGSETLASNWGGFLTTSYTSADQDETQTLAGYNADTYSVVLGVDYRFGNNRFAGVAARLGTTNADLDGNSGSLDALDGNITLYSSMFITDKLFLDATAHYGAAKFDLDRKLDFTAGAVSVKETAKSDTRGDQYGASLGAGYEWQLAKAVSTQFLANVRYNSASIDGYKESDASGVNLKINDLDFETLTSKLGLQLSVPFSLSWGVLVPQVNAYWLHEFKTDGEKVQASFLADPFNTQFAFTSDDLDEDYYNASVGVALTMPRGFNMFVQYETYLDYDNYEKSVVSLGARMEF